MAPHSSETPQATEPEQAGQSGQAEPGTDLLDRARAVAGVAAEHADDVDQQGRIPTEALQALREHRLLSLLISPDEGGEGRSVRDCAQVVELIARGCANTGMILAMHYNQVSGLVRHAGTESFAAERRRIAAEQLLIASATTEIGIGGDVRRSTCAVEPDDDGHFKLVKNAPVISYAEVADIILVTARRDLDAAANDQVLVYTEKADTSLEPTRGWDTLGFRGTCSPGYILTTTGTVDKILPEPFAQISAHTMLPCSHIFWASVWLGISRGAVQKARRYVQAAARKKPGTVPPGATRLAEVQILVESFAATVDSAARRVDDAPPGSADLDSVGFAIAMNGLKVFASTEVVDIVGRAMLVTGIEGYRQDSEYSLGRYLRDAHGAALMVNNDRILGHTASLELINRGER